MNSQISCATCTHIIPYDDKIKSQELLDKSLKLQKKQTAQLKSVSLRALFSSGAYPTPQYDKKKAPLVPLNREEFLNATSDIVHKVISYMDYNGIQPFVKLINHVKQGQLVSDLELNAEGEFPSTTCVGMTEAILKAIKHSCGFKGLLVAQRKRGQLGFQHACALFYLKDGLILIDPVSDPSKRIYSLPYNGSAFLGDKQFATASPQESIPIQESSPLGNFEYCARILNAKDLILKHYMAEEPFLSASNPAFPISAYNSDGSASKCIWISLINETLTLKNLTYSKQDKRRTNELDIEELEDDELIKELKVFYEAGSPTFKIPFHQLCLKLLTFVDNIDLVKSVFESVHV